MDRKVVVLCLSVPALLAGCDAADTGAGQDGQPPEAPAADLTATPGAEPMDGTTSATLGPIRYRYDPSLLTVAEVLIDLPPDHDDEILATKLLPVERAALLGQDSCHYGESGRTETCAAEKEPGLVLALLERPLADYRKAFEEDGLADELAPAQLDGSRGFRFIEQAEGSGTEYRFLPMEERTVLVARQFAPGQGDGGEAILQVIRSLAVGLSESTR